MANYSLKRYEKLFVLGNRLLDEELLVLVRVRRTILSQPQLTLHPRLTRDSQPYLSYSEIKSWGGAFKRPPICWDSVLHVETLSKMPERLYAAIPLSTISEPMGIAA
jgi:hypothetical protein